MRVSLAVILLLALVQTAHPQGAVSHRWTLGFAMGTLEAIIKNRAGSTFNIYCPSGQLDTTPGFFYHPKRIKFRVRQEVTIQIIVDGQNYPFLSKEGHFRAHGRIARQTFQSLAIALSKSRSDVFTIEMPDINFKEIFSLRDAYKTVGSENNSTVIDDCLKN